MTASAPRAARLVVGVTSHGRDVRFPYVVDGARHGEISVSYPFSLTSSHRRLLGPVAAGIATYLGQLCLAREIQLDFPVDPAVVEALAPIVSMLYDVRCWKDERPLADLPRLVVARDAPQAPLAFAAQPRRSLLLFSGGKDSTLAAIALRQNDFDVEALHVTANASVKESESRAVTALAPTLDAKLTTLRYRHDDFTAFSRAYAVNWDAFPHFNAVPFGRDLVLALLAIPVLAERGIGTLSLGHDHDCRTAHVTYGGRTFPRNDIESAEGAIALERYIQRFLTPGVTLLPPLARISEFRVLREMFERWPELMGQTAFCFWGARCGRCAKCLRYFLAQRVFGREGTLRFDANPLAQGVCPELDDILASWGGERVLFDREVLYMLGRLVEADDVRPGEDAVERFRRLIQPEVAPLLRSWEVELDRLYRDPQVPDSFAPVVPAMSSELDRLL